MIPRIFFLNVRYFFYDSSLAIIGQKLSAVQNFEISENWRVTLLLDEIVLTPLSASFRFLRGVLCSTHLFRVTSAIAMGLS